VGCQFADAIAQHRAHDREKVGWNTVTFDVYYSELASSIADILKTDRAIMQLRWALAACLDDRKRGRQSERQRRRN
jgi:hypothetical protein